MADTRCFPTVRRAARASSPLPETTAAASCSLRSSVSAAAPVLLHFLMCAACTPARRNASAAFATVVPELPMSALPGHCADMAAPRRLFADRARNAVQVLPAPTRV